MADTDTLDDVLLEEEEKKKRQQEQPIGKPIGPAAPAGVPVGGGQTSSVGAPIVPKGTVPAQAPAAPELAQPAAPNLSGIGTSINVPAPRPRGEELTKGMEPGGKLATPTYALDKTDPNYRHQPIKHFLDTLAGTTSIGTAIERAGGFGTQGHEANLARSRERAGTEEAQIEHGEKERQATAQTQETTARAGREEAAGKAAEAGMENVTIVGQNGVTYSVPRKDAERLLGVIAREQGATARTHETNVTREDIASIEAANKLAVSQGKPQPHITTMIGGKAHVMERDPQSGEYSIDRGEAPPNYAAVAPSLRTVDIISPNTGLPTITTLTGREVGTAGTGPMIGMGQMAQTVMTQTPRIKEEIKRIESKLGPASGRWHDIYVNRVGGNDPEFAGLDADLDLLASAIVRTHFGARGGQQYREALHKRFGTAQTADDLISRIDHAEEWIEGYAKMARPSGGNANPPNPTPPAPTGGGGFANWKANQRP